MSLLSPHSALINREYERIEGSLVEVGVGVCMLVGSREVGREVGR